MTNIEILSRFISNCLNVTTTPYTPEVTKIDLVDMEEKYIYEIENIFGVKTVLFLFEETKIVVGPFVTKSWENNKIKNKFSKKNTTNSLYTSYKLYYTKLPFTSSDEVKNIINSAINAFYPNSSKYIYKFINHSENSTYEEMYYEKFEDYELVMKIYYYENAFLDLIKLGKVEEVLNAKKKLNEVYKNSNKEFFNKYNYSLDAARTGLQSSRSLIRKAAEGGGLNPAIINSITQKYAQKINASNSISQMIEFENELILELTKKVHRKNREAYSNSINNTIDYIDIHFSKQLTINIIAENTQLSEGHLSRLFKKEVGVTIFDYIKDLRCKEARKLLITTNMPIQYISEAVGYSDNNYFTKVFKDKFSETPSAIRNKHRVGNFDFK